MHRTRSQAADANQHRHAGPQQPVPVDIPRIEQIVYTDTLGINHKPSMNNYNITIPNSRIFKVLILLFQ